MLTLLKFILVTIGFAVDVPEPFNPWVHTNIHKKYKIFEQNNERILEVTIKADHPQLPYLKSDKMHFLQGYGKDHTWYLIQKSNTDQNKNKKSYTYEPSNVTCSQSHKISQETANSIVITHGSNTQKYEQTKNKIDLSQQNFHPGKPIKLISCWQMDDEKFLVAITNRSTGCLLALLQGDPDYLETLTWINNGVDPDGYTCTQLNSSIRKYIKTKKGHRVQISSDGVSFIPLTRIVGANYSQILKESIRMFAPELRWIKKTNPCDRLAIELINSPRASEPIPVSQPIKKVSSTDRLSRQRISRKNSSSVIANLKKAESLEAQLNSNLEDIWKSMPHSARSRRDTIS